MNRLVREGLFGSLIKIELLTCEHCFVRKATRKYFGKGTKSQISLQLLYADICGSMNLKARHGAIYFITFINDFICHSCFFLISHKPAT